MAKRAAYRWLIAGTFSVVSALAWAANGVTITQADERKVSVGMDKADVERSLGRPARIIQYPRQPGPTWMYDVVGAPFGITRFDIDFGADGKVTSASEQIIGNPW